MKVRISGADICDSMFPHDRGDIEIVKPVPDICGYSLARSRTTSACRSVSIRILKEGNARNASMKCQACENERGWAKAEGCVATLRNS